jgi:putative tryptophan/tyrosine transport system substrate-binding protein
MNEIRRRHFLIASGALLATPFAVGAQPARRIPLIAFVANRPGPIDLDHAFLSGLREFGYIEGKNIRIEYRWGDGIESRWPVLFKDVISMNPDLIVSAGAQGGLAAKNATTSIPVVMTSSSDPVREGVVASLARPGGNVTGMSTFVTEMSHKRIELLKESLPKLARVATIWNSANPGSLPLVRDTALAAKALGLTLHSVGVSQASELDTAFASIARERGEALSVISDTFIFTNRRLIQALAAQYRVPAIYPGDPYIEAGGLMSYGPSTAAAYHRAAYFVDRILKGTRPADLPVEQPIKFELVINLKTAKALGIAFPQSILSRVDRIIQ